MSRRTCFLAAAALAAFLPADASARATAKADDRAVGQAADAFGMRVGVEQIGLYSESQVRGFSLQDAGNYRLNGAYFAKSSNLVDPVLSGVITRVGINALDSDYAAPSGVVDYRIRSPFDAAPIAIEAARREYGGQFYELGAALKSKDGRGAVVLAAQASLATSSAGLSNRAYRYGGVAEWRFAQSGRLIAFAALNQFDLEGSYGFSLAGSALPPRLVHPRRYVPSWGDHDGEDINGGLILSAPVTDEVEMAGSLVYSRLNLDKADFALMTVGPDGLGRATAISNRPRTVASWSGSASTNWRHAPGRRLYAEARARRTVNAFAPSMSIDLGAFDQNEGLRPTPAPVLAPMPRTRDQTEQLAAGLGYEASLGQVRLKGGLQKAFHERTISPPGEAARSSTKTPWLYEASAAYAITPAWTAFVSATRGLEESGTAPNNAVNRNDVLPAAIATQQEVGVRGRLSDQLTVIASAFSIEKPAAGFDALGVYRLIGELRHRGLELSLTGQLTPDLRVVAGAAYLQARRDGDLVEAGVWSKEAVGIPQVQAMAGLTYSVPWATGLSLDGQLSYFSDRRAQSQGALRTPALATVDVGFLYNFQSAGKKLALRGRVLNLFDTDVWVASRSELLDRPNRRGARLSLAMRY